MCRLIITMFTLKHITSMLTRMGFQVMWIRSCIIAMLTLKDFPNLFRQTSLLDGRLIRWAGRTKTFRCFTCVIKLMLLVLIIGVDISENRRICWNKCIDIVIIVLFNIYYIYQKNTYTRKSDNFIKKKSSNKNIAEYVKEIFPRISNK